MNHSDESIKIEGRYFSLFRNYESDPLPEQNELTPEHREFIRKFSVVCEIAQRGGFYTRVRGLSVCPYCSRSVEFSDYEYKGWFWSGEYVHAVSVHGVKPSEEFAAFIEAEYQNIVASNIPLSTGKA